MRGEPLQAFRLVQCGVARMQQVCRRVVDIHQHRVEAATGRGGIEPIRRMRHREEVGIDETAARIAGQLLAERQQTLLVPFDDLGKRVDHDQRPHAGIFQHRLRGVAKPETADDHVEVAACQCRQSQPREFDLGRRELARHQVFVAELDFEDVDA